MEKWFRVHSYTPLSRSNIRIILGLYNGNENGNDYSGSYMVVSQNLGDPNIDSKGPPIRVPLILGNPHMGLASPLRSPGCGSSARVRGPLSDGSEASLSLGFRV